MNKVKEENIERLKEVGSALITAKNKLILYEIDYQELKNDDTIKDLRYVVELYDKVSDLAVAVYKHIAFLQGEK